MIFCGSRIKTYPAEGNPAEQLELLEMKKGMWKCEKEAINRHNAQVRLQNKGTALAMLKTLDMSFLGKLNKDKHPVFGVFPTTSFSCTLNVTCGWEGKFSSLSCGLPKAIGDGYKHGLKGKTLGSGSRRYRLEANFVGLLPQRIKDKIIALKEAGIKTYLVANTTWEKVVVKPVDPDPLVIAVYRKKVYLVDVFDASIEENYVAKEFSEDAQSN